MLSNGHVRALEGRILPSPILVTPSNLFETSNKNKSARFGFSNKVLGLECSEDTVCFFRDN